MSKGKQKNKSQIEQLRGQLREVEAENGRLREIIKELEKDPEVKKKRQLARKKAKESSFGVCNECGKGNLTEVDFGRVKIEKCDLCDYRRKIE